MTSPNYQHLSSEGALTLSNILCEVLGQDLIFIVYPPRDEIISDGILSETSENTYSDLP